VSNATLRKALVKNSAEPDQDGLYTTQQIAAAIYGALHIEKIKTQRQITERITLENQITRGKMLNRAEIAKGLAMVADAMTSRIMAADIPGR